MVKLSVVVPAFNASLFIENALVSISGKLNFDHEIIVVDDASTDATVATIKALKFKNAKTKIKIIELAENSGPGAARNAGLSEVTGEYVLFFDADDQVIGENLIEAINLLDRFGSDVAVLKYVLCRTRNESLFSNMDEKDEKLFDSVLWGMDVRVINLRDFPQILQTTNFPWNKVFRTEFVKNIDLKFPLYRLHEDIIPCWHSLLEASGIIVISKPIGYHYLPQFGNNMSNIKSNRRLDIFVALSEVADLLEREKVDWKIYREFVYFSIDVLGWAKTLIPQESIKEFRYSVKDLFGSITGSELLYAIEFDNGLVYTFHGALKELLG